uniref:Proteasome maturation protein n=1 Tax=Ailuropoda melanoleuca TaxID=9646 RepID=A0A7N5P1I0_AILME
MCHVFPTRLYNLFHVRLFCGILPPSLILFCLWLLIIEYVLIDNCGLTSYYKFQLNQDKMNFSTLRNIQGLFAPLKLQMEFKAVQQVQRLPFLPSSNLSLDILRGNDETIGFEDILNDPSQSELMGEPHLMVEYKLGLL